MPQTDNVFALKALDLDNVNNRVNKEVIACILRFNTNRQKVEPLACLSAVLNQKNPYINGGPPLVALPETLIFKKIIDDRRHR